MWKIVSVVLHKTEILLIQPSLRMHLQPQILTTVWTKRKKPSNHLAFRWNLFSKNLKFLLQMYIKASYHKYHFKSFSNPPIKQTPQNKNTNSDHQYIFTEGSKDSNKTAYAAVLNKTTHKKALPMKSSIFTAEVCAIDLVLNIISGNKHIKFIIFSDLLSVLT